MRKYKLEIIVSRYKMEKWKGWLNRWREEEKERRQEGGMRGGDCGWGWVKCTLTNGLTEGLGELRVLLDDHALGGHNVHTRSCRQNTSCVNCCGLCHLFLPTLPLMPRTPYCRKWNPLPWNLFTLLSSYSCHLHSVFVSNLCTNLNDSSFVTLVPTGLLGCYFFIFMKPWTEFL